jgi:hypothetical protein
MMTNTQRAAHKVRVENEIRRLTESDVASMPYSTEDGRYQNRLAEAAAKERIANSNRRKKLMAEEEARDSKRQPTLYAPRENKAKKEVIKKARGGKIDGKALKGKTKGRMV